MVHLIGLWIVTTISFIILTKLPTGIESDSLGKAGLAALVFGLLNGLAGWLVGSTILNVLTLGLVYLIGNTILFGLTALFVKGFRLKWGVISAFIGAMGVTVINSVLTKILEGVGILAIGSETLIG